MADKLTHIDENNNPQMVDISDKADSSRMALAQCRVVLPKTIQKAMVDGEIQSKKGPVFHTAIIAGVMAAKKTHELIPFCHPLMLQDCKIDIQIEADKNLLIQCMVKVFGQTGVEMEALTGCSVAALTVYDMCKAMSHNIILEQTRLIKKTGGKSETKP